jgi:hypothetical protein
MERMALPCSCFLLSRGARMEPERATNSPSHLQCCPKRPHSCRGVAAAPQMLRLPPVRRPRAAQGLQGSRAPSAPHGRAGSRVAAPTACSRAGSASPHRAWSREHARPLRNLRRGGAPQVPPRAALFELPFFRCCEAEKRVTCAWVCVGTTHTGWLPTHVI